MEEILFFDVYSGICLKGTIPKRRIVDRSNNKKSDFTYCIDVPRFLFDDILRFPFFGFFLLFFFSFIYIYIHIYISVSFPLVFVESTRANNSSGGQFASILYSFVECWELFNYVPCFRSAIVTEEIFERFPKQKKNCLTSSALRKKRRNVETSDAFLCI